MPLSATECHGVPRCATVCHEAPRVAAACRCRVSLAIAHCCLRAQARPQVPEDSKHFIAAPLLAVTHGWNYLLTLTTFVTTFFVGHSHTFWRKSYGLTRVVQGRINDLGLLCAVHAKRDAQGALAPEARAVLLDVARYLRLSHVLFWAGEWMVGHGEWTSHVLLWAQSCGLLCAVEQTRATGARWTRARRCACCSRDSAWTGCSSAACSAPGSTPRSSARSCRRRAGTL